MKKNITVRLGRKLRHQAHCSEHTLSRFLGWAGFVSQCGASSGLQTGESVRPHQKSVTKEAVLTVGPSFFLCFYSFRQQIFQGPLLCATNNIFPNIFLCASLPSCPPSLLPCVICGSSFAVSLPLYCFVFLLTNFLVGFMVWLPNLLYKIPQTKNPKT